MNFREKMSGAWLKFSGRILLLLSDKDYTAKEFLGLTKQDQDWKKIWENPALICHEIPGADHTFSSALFRSQVEKLTLDYVLNTIPK
jgi:hypothetical protein